MQMPSLERDMANSIWITLDTSITNDSLNRFILISVIHHTRSIDEEIVN